MRVVNNPFVRRSPIGPDNTTDDAGGEKSDRCKATDSDTDNASGRPVCDNKWYIDFQQPMCKCT